MANDEFGDFQTPANLVNMCLRSLPQDVDWLRILEPACGLGSFLSAAKEVFPLAERHGIEIQQEYAETARQYAPVINEDIFSLNLGSDIPWKGGGSLLVIGNPPWVTVANLSVLGSDNLPVKENLKRLTGLEAMTGASNFDIAEYIWIKLLKDLEDQEPTISLLCKTQVARNVLAFAHQAHFPIASANLRRINSMKWFGAGVDACLFTVRLSSGASNYACDVFDDFSDSQPVSRFGVINGKVISDLDAHAEFEMVDGASPIEWRQGIKHDATDVMELVEMDGPRQKSGEPVDIEDAHLFPMLKCTDVFRGRLTPNKYMVVPIRSLNEDAAELQHKAPRLWNYLVTHGDKLDGRKSSIYKARSRFCIFGVGPYSFAPYKVAISGLHKQPTFRIVAPTAEGREVVFDDTCYFLSFDELADACLVGALLRSEAAQRTIQALAFWDSKRPITKKLLQRIDLAKLIEVCEREAILSDALALSREVDSSLEMSDVGTALDALGAQWAIQAPSLSRRGKSSPASSADVAEPAVQFGLF